MLGTFYHKLPNNYCYEQSAYLRRKEIRQKRNSKWCYYHKAFSKNRIQPK